MQEWIIIKREIFKFNYFLIMNQKTNKAFYMTTENAILPLNERTMNK